MNTGEWMLANGLDKFHLAHSQRGKIVWLRCVNQGCNDKPFKVTQGEIDDAEGFIECEICSQPCEQAK